MEKREAFKIPVGFEEVKDDLEFELFDNEGDRVVGILTGWRTFGNINGNYPSAILETVEGAKVAVPCGTKLVNMLEPIPVGTVVLIEFRGWQQPKGKRAFKDFYVAKSNRWPEDDKAYLNDTKPAK